MTPDLTPHLTALREALESSPCSGRSLNEIQNFLPCSLCKDTGKYVRPEWEALYKLVVEDCPVCDGGRAFNGPTAKWPRKDYFQEVLCRKFPTPKNCGGTGYILRRCWDELRAQGIDALGPTIYQIVNKKAAEERSPARFWLNLYRQLFAASTEAKDFTLAALEAVTRAVRQEVA